MIPLKGSFQRSNFICSGKLHFARINQSNTQLLLPYQRDASFLRKDILGNLMAGCDVGEAQFIYHAAVVQSNHHKQKLR